MGSLFCAQQLATRLMTFVIVLWLCFTVAYAARQRLETENNDGM